MDLNRAQQTPIPGYEHPVSLNLKRSRMYKTFSENKKAKKNEQFGTTDTEIQYASHGNVQNKENCIVCNQVALHTCNCAYNDKTCSNNHVWYTDREGNIKVGNPH